MLDPIEPLAEMGRWLCSLVPRRLRFRVKLNFIMVHYIYILSMGTATAVIIYGDGFMSFVDAIFFGLGAATQSGLNTIDINKLFLYQQITFMIVASVCTPIFIHCATVFVRLYWFEKRFKNIVQEARARRRLGPHMSRTKSEGVNGADGAPLERGETGRKIEVIHETTQPNGMNTASSRSEESKQIEVEFKEMTGLNSTAENVTPSTISEQGRTSNGDQGDYEQKTTSQIPAAGSHHLGLHPMLHGHDGNSSVTNDDRTPSTSQAALGPEVTRLPKQQDLSKHLEFLERQQRNARDRSAYKIPGPRDYDRGEVPQQIEEPIASPHPRHVGGSLDLDHMPTHADDEQPMAGIEEVTSSNQVQRVGTKILFDDQRHPGHKSEEDGEVAGRAQMDTSGRLGLRQMASNVSRLRRGRSNPNRTGFSTAGSLGRTFTALTNRSGHNQDDPMPYLSWTATTGRNSAFVGLTDEQRDELGGIEYRALKTLVKVLIGYFVGFHIAGMVVLLPWILHTSPWNGIVSDFGVNPAWWGVFTPASLFNDLGFTLTPNSMLSFQQAVLPLSYGSFLIIIGNTGFPCMLRFVIWVASKCVAHGTPMWEELRFLLDHPRRCFTLLFPSRATWWLFWILVGLNGVDLIFFIILDINDETVTSLKPGYRVLNGWFQATSTRTAGFSSVNIADLHPAMQVSYMIMMYISVFPIAISLRRTNVYEEKSLGIWNDKSESPGYEDKSYVGHHLRRQLSFDLWYVFLGLFIIAVVEGSRLEDTTKVAFNMFAVLFEIVSAYGTVGLSLGYPGTNTSFSAQFRTISKLVIVAMMIRGRHRGLPYALDRAILLPSENLQKKEAEDADLRFARRNSMANESVEHTNSGPPRPRTQNGDDMDPPAADVGKDPPPTPGARNQTSGTSASASSSQRHHHGHHRQQSWSLGRVIAGGLSAGPTLSKHD